MDRLNWVQYWSGPILNAVRERATCDRGKSGCVIIKDNDQISSGYVGAPPGQPHCDDVGHQLEYRWQEQMSYAPNDVWAGHPENNDLVLVRREHCVRTIHAEMNAITRAARRGVLVRGATLFCSMYPCWDCAKAIVAAGIVAVVIVKNYHASDKSKKLFADCDVFVNLLDDCNETYPT